MIHIEKYFTPNDRKALYDLLHLKKQGKIPVLEHLMQHRHKHSFRSDLPLLLNPVIDEPSDFIEFCADGMVIGKNDRGKKSIEIYGLDRQQLNIRRKAIVDRIRDSIALTVTLHAQNLDKHFFINIIKHYLIQLIKDIDNPKSTFIAFRHTVLNKFDHFIITNREHNGDNVPFEMPFQVELLNAYQSIKNKG
jgi:hypothetical protein